MTSKDEGLGANLMSRYSRLVGGIQVLYAFFFGWVACRCFDEVVTKCGGKCIYCNLSDIESGTAYHVSESSLAYGMVSVLLGLYALIGGCGLLALRPWARYWEIAYLAVVFTCSVVVIAIAAIRDQGPWLILFITMIFAVSYLPFILPEPFKFSRAGRVP